MSLSRRVLSQLTIVGLTALMGGVFVATLHRADQEMIVSVAAVVLILLSLIGERLMPHNTAWNQDQGETLGDVGSFMLVFGILDGALKWLTPIALVALLPALGLAPNAATAELPLIVQIIAVTLLIELGAWISHWAHHRYPQLWQLHAMHHSTERLYTLNNFRFHPLNHMTNHLIMIVPPLALGFAPEAILAYTLLSMPVLLLQHSNIAFDFGWLNRVLNTNDLHRWHHSSTREEGTQNLGRALVLWDHAFATYYNPRHVAEPATIGLFPESRNYPAPQRWLSQLAWPLTRTCCPKCCG